ncbi:ATP synthase F1 subunit epsilon [Bosea sp. BH3]|uniref:ATP synthase F1 subunit epsilon n=1 Tax=Bosea sp. BH3 TaxID=2871701 RepID=UPI0021CB16F4|nr:ATP synthase F1 subunit epsilon [Bosea sp. BH3]MCU4178530.1 ATP synthase F1 subunit epsilon [Bosea sp. BH3]
MATFKFELVSPERILFSGEIISVIVPSVEGEMTVLPGHVPIVAALKPGVVLVQTSAENGKEFFVGGGLVEVNQTSVTILAERANFIEDVNSDVLDAAILSVETRLAAAPSEVEERRLREMLVQLEEFKHVFEQRKAA